MATPRFLSLRLRWLALGAGWLLTARHACAQQDRSFRDRIDHPDTSLRAEGFDKTFTPSSSSVNKTAVVKSFAFSRAATTSGDGTFRTRNFTGNKEGFRTSGYTTKTAALAGRGVAQSDRVYDTKATSVKTDRDAGKSADVHVYQPSSQTFTPHGKRQEEIDDLRRQKRLSIDQVREILNKNK